MGSYDKWVGDVEDFTDEEVADFNIGAVCRERIVRLRLAWAWCMVRRESDALLPGESAVLGMLAGRGHRAGTLRQCAEELYLLVTVPEDGAGLPILPQWRVDGGASTTARLQKMLKSAPLEDLCMLYQKEVDALLRRVATMTKAIPRYNRSVVHSRFPQATWDKGTRQMTNKAMHRFEKELSTWELCLSNLQEGR